MTDTTLSPCPICGGAPLRNGRGGSGGVLCYGKDVPGLMHRLQVYGNGQDEADATWNHRAQMTTRQTPDAVREAEIAAMARALIPSYEDRGNGYDKTLAVLRYAAALDSRAGDAGEGKAYRCRGCGWRGSEPIANGHPQNGCDLELMVHDPIATPAPAVDAPVMIPREPTQAMMDAGLYHSSHDTEWADVNTMWKAMYDAITLDGGTSTSAPAVDAVPAAEKTR